jgi:hypothetical protein
MPSKFRFLSWSGAEAEVLELPSNFILLHGAPLDARGALALNVAGCIEKINVSYDVECMALSANGISVSADNCEDLFVNLNGNVPVVLEATTLGFAELFCVVRALTTLGLRRIEVIYLEPADYSREQSSSDRFALSDDITGYRPIPHSIVDLTGDDVESGVFFLGFESDRLERAISEHQMIVSKEIKVVFGIPAFQPGWELNSIVPHIPLLNELTLDISYCAANDPEAAFETLESTRSALSHGKKMFIAPIGTKPCGLAAAIFASAHRDQVGLLFDHPKRKVKRSEGASIWHRYSVVFPDA